MIESVTSAQEDSALVLIFYRRSPDYIWSGEERQIVFDCADRVSRCATYHYYPVSYTHLTLPTKA